MPVDPLEEWLDSIEQEARDVIDAIEHARISAANLRVRIRDRLHDLKVDAAAATIPGPGPEMGKPPRTAAPRSEDPDEGIPIDARLAAGEDRPDDLLDEWLRSGQVSEGLAEQLRADLAAYGTAFVRVSGSGSIDRVPNPGGVLVLRQSSGKASAY